MRLLRKFFIKMGEKKYKKRELKKNNYKKAKLEILIWIVTGVVALLYFRSNNYSAASIELALGIVAIGLAVYILFSCIRIKKEFNEYEHDQVVREFRIVQQIEDKRELARDVLTQIILKNRDGYDIKTWNIGKSTSLLIGKNSRIKVEIDLLDTGDSHLVSRSHAVLNKTDKGWYLEDLNSRNGTGLERLSDSRKIKLENEPLKVQSGDKVYIGKIVLLLK
ncbi:MAG: FHA domain-containing protein [Fusobacteriaceae bacterium]